MPSCTGVVQAGSRRFTPDTSTMHRRQAPTGVRLSSQHRVGIYLPLARATSKIVWPSCAATYSPSVRIESLSGKQLLLYVLLRNNRTNRSLTVAAPLPIPSRDREGVPMGRRPTQGDGDAGERWGGRARALSQGGGGGAA